MKVRELIAELQMCDGDDEVGFGWPYGDHVGRMVVTTVKRVDYENTIYSAYIQGLQIANPDIEYDDDEEIKEMVVLQ